MTWFFRLKKRFEGKISGQGQMMSFVDCVTKRKMFLEMDECRKMCQKFEKCADQVFIYFD